MTHGPSATCEHGPSGRPSGLAPLGEATGGWDFTVALAGNPNTGKSTVFNALTGLRQHTGNWPGKTVARAEGRFAYEGRKFRLVDLPGTYSLLSASQDEQIARDFVLFGRPDVTVIVVDAQRLERNLNLVLQILAITERAVVCLNLIDEARRHGVEVDALRLGRELGVPVVATAARYGEGLETLQETILGVAMGKIASAPRRLSRWSRTLENAVRQISQEIERLFPALPNADWLALRLLDGDASIVRALEEGDLARLSEEGPADGSQLATAKLIRDARASRWQIGPGFHQSIVETIYAVAGQIADSVVTRPHGAPRFDLDRTLDRIVTSRLLGFPLMVLLLTVVFWLTITGANWPSAMLSSLLIDTVHPALKSAASAIGLPWWLDGPLIDGMYLTTAWVVSVMLPPMAIFFPLFTLLEDFGYLPRVAFNLDRMFKRVGAHGKQALTMAMGYGCNAAGVIATRIVESPRERLIAIITNNFSLCNGRWPTQILVASVFIGSLTPAYLAGLISALAVVGIALLGVVLTFATSWLLSRTWLRGEVSAFSLELPPYRRPRVLQTLYTSLIDRTLFVLWRAVVFALPAGAAIWLIGNVHVGEVSLATLAIEGLDPIGVLFGLSGIILLAYIVAIPANEIVIPTILMLTVLTRGVTGIGEGAGVLFELDSQADTGQLLRAGGWTLLTAVNLMLFSLVHNPCSTTLYTIWKETRSIRWTLVSALLPLGIGLTLCFSVTRLWRLLAATS
ncbi:MAG: ferrous iron transport protein B [Acidobacteriota bacterium]|nr:MAG: ferrous iron transport protein B [Acidobacteriota bacterium]